MGDQTITDYNPHPGEHIRDEMDEIGVSKAELARALGIPRTRVSEILRGRRGITADTALRLARWLDTAPQMWLNLEAIHDLRKVEDEAGDAIRAQVTPLRRAGSPAREVRKRSVAAWLSDVVRIRSVRARYRHFERRP